MSLKIGLSDFSQLVRNVFTVGGNFLTVSWAASGNSANKSEKIIEKTSRSGLNGIFIAVRNPASYHTISKVSGYRIIS
jgi:hypothetical protein